METETRNNDAEVEKDTKNAKGYYKVARKKTPEEVVGEEGSFEKGEQVKDTSQEVEEDEGEVDRTDEDDEKASNQDGVDPSSSGDDSESSDEDDGEVKEVGNL